MINDKDYGVIWKDERFATLELFPYLKMNYDQSVQIENFMLENTQPQ